MKSEKMSRRDDRIKKLLFIRAIRKSASSMLSAALQICYRTITNASRRSHCGGSESCHLRDPPQAKNPAKQDSFLLIKWRSLRTLLSSDFRASTESEPRRIRVNCGIKKETSRPHWQIPYGCKLRFLFCTI